VTVQHWRSRPPNRASAELKAERQALPEAEVAALTMNVEAIRLGIVVPPMLRRSFVICAGAT
jgi:hypothetical protein